jgi:SAM-dependent methyltransferase
MLDPDVLNYALGALPPAPARVLEVGAGDGELAQALASAGYDVVAIDPGSTAEHVRPIPLYEVDEPANSFDAAVAIVSLHHVEPLPESCRRLAELVRPGGALVIDEIDLDRFDERVARWWLDHRPPDGHEAPPPAEIVATLRHHIHALGKVRDALDPWFELGPEARGPYLYRWELGPEVRGPEEDAIETGRLPAVGVRILGTRKPDPA